MKMKMKLGVCSIALLLVTGLAQAGSKFGAPTEGMTKEEYQSLVFLDPQNSLRMDWDAVKDMDGYFLIDNQGDPSISVVDYNKEETIQKIDMGETGNHHIFIIPGGKYAWSSQRYEKDLMWTIDLTTLKVVDKFNLSMDGKKIIAPLHIGFANTKPLAVVGNILDEKNGYLTILNSATRKPQQIVELSCPGARDAMFSPDDSLIFATCQQKPKGIAVVDTKTMKEIKMIPIEGARTGGMDPQGKYFLVGVKGSIQIFDTKTAELVKKIEVPGGGGNFTCLADGSKCYNGLRKADKLAVIDMKKLELIKTIDAGPDANRLYLNPANPRYGIFANEGGKSDFVTVIDTQKDVAVTNIITGLGPHNVAFDPKGKRAIVTTKKEDVATLIDTSNADPSKWSVITTDIEAGIQHNGVRWVPTPDALKAAIK